jgi:2-amino-4-hydroxy-6-hydroxymethyldihydropteridine diphosphokinase
LEPHKIPLQVKINEMVPVVVALGSNVGDSLRYLRLATESLSEILSNLRLSAVYKTAPMYVEDQPPFLNAAALGETNLGPLELLANLKRIEAEIGRNPRQRYGPREIDLDLVAYGSLAYRGPRLQVPHPRTPERRFVLLPMFDIAPNLRLATMGTVESLLIQTQSQAEDVVPIEDALLPISGYR